MLNQLSDLNLLDWAQMQYFFIIQRRRLGMHEWALAEAVLTSARQIADQEHLTSVSEVTIRVGELQGIDRPILRFALKQLSEGGFFKHTKFHILKAKSQLKCRVCGATWNYNTKKIDKSYAEAIHFVPEVAHTYIKCPKCSSPDFEIASGRGVWLEDLKGAKQD